MPRQPCWRNRHPTVAKPEPEKSDGQYITKKKNALSQGGIMANMHSYSLDTNNEIIFFLDRKENYNKVIRLCI